MREIKFRAWDKAYKAMCHSPKGFEHVSAWLKNPEIFVVMQYTGLRDKNGVEIYEGDILERSRAGRGPIGRFSVRWRISETGCGFNLKGTSPLKTLEVVGNVYESPELFNAAA